MDQRRPFFFFFFLYGTEQDEERTLFFSLSRDEFTSSCYREKNGTKRSLHAKKHTKSLFLWKEIFFASNFFFFFLSREIKQKDFLRRVTGETHRRPTDASSLTTHWIHVLVYTHTRPISCLHIHKHTFKCRAAKKGNEEKKREPDEQKNFNCFLLWKKKINK